MNNKVYYGEYSLAYWIELILKENIELPEYQRYFVWEKKDFDTLIDSFKNNQFVPPITIGSYLEDDKNRNYIIDGQQRLTTILLAYLKRFPKREAFERDIQLLANENDDSNEEEEDELQESMMEWTFRNLTGKGKTKDEILGKCSNEHYISLSIDLDDDFFQNHFLGFCYIVPDVSETNSQLQYYSTVFRNINIKGKPLYNLESRAALYFLDNTLKDWFNPNFTREISSSIVDRSAKTRMDFVRYLSLLSQYKKNGNTRRLAYGYASRMESYYETYIYTVIRNEDSALFGQFTSLYIDKNYSGQMAKLNHYIDELELRKYYPSIIDMDIYFFGLINSVLFQKQDLDITKKAELLAALQRKILQIKRDPKHTKTPSLQKFFKERIEQSVSIYQSYLLQ